VNSCRVVFIILMVLMISCPSLAADRGMEIEEIYIKANQAYKDGLYEDAAASYLDIMDAGGFDAHIEYNLGNTYYRMDRIGLAILHYERSKIHMPRDADLDFNLRYVLDKRMDDIEETEGFVSMTFFWLKSLSLAELYWGFVGVNLVLFLVLFIRLFIKSEWSYYVLLVIIPIWSVMALSCGIKQYQAFHDDRAVIIEEEVNVLAGPDDDDTLLFKLHEGSIVHEERVEDGWALIGFSNDKRGWVPSGDLERIRAGM